MADRTKIEWTDATWNVVNGCSVHGPGCKNCYAMKQAHRVEARRGLTEKTAGGMVWTGEVRFNEKVPDQPLRWKKPRRIFVCAHGDLFHENVPDEWIDRVFAVMALCPQHTFQVLTKRSGRMREYFAGDQLMERIDCEIDALISERVDPLARRSNDLRAIAPVLEEAWPLPNVWLGVSVEDQRRANERIPDLLATPAAIRWLSCEPLLEELTLTHISVGHSGELNALTGNWRSWPISDGPRGPVLHQMRDLPGLDWIVAGGESGPNARPMHPDWARSLRDQCEAAGVPFLFKQWGEHLLARERHLHGFPPGAFVDHLDAGDGYIRVGKKRAGRVLDGVQHDGFPEPQA